MVHCELNLVKSFSYILIWGFRLSIAYECVSISQTHNFKGTWYMLEFFIGILRTDTYHYIFKCISYTWLHYAHNCVVVIVGTCEWMHWFMLGGCLICCYVHFIVTVYTFIYTNIHNLCTHIVSLNANLYT